MVNSLSIRLGIEAGVQIIVFNFSDKIFTCDRALHCSIFFSGHYTALLYKHQQNTTGAFAGKHDIFTGEKKKLLLLYYIIS